MSSEFPKILSNIPEGIDLFKAESHKKISNSIINIIENQSNLIDKQIIGLEGDWGTGKSNIIKIIEQEISKRDELKDKYLHFTFDVWTHQEDLTRKSIIIELINSLRDKINSFKSDEWVDREAQLSQKRISKNTKHFPQIKLYYVFLVIGFVIIKFINEIKKQIINGKLYGYYDNSLSYLKNEFYISFSKAINYTYFYKIVPYLFFIISFILFFKSFFKDLKTNKRKDKSDKSKLTFWELVGKSFYWISGEKLETNSDETITETEPSNLRFKKFLNDIDSELTAKSKTLILTIDNTDRLTGEKLKSIWSIINVFFAENNNAGFLKNIWLIIPFDSQKVIDSFENTAGIGLLEKTFTITFKVPPPLISNWELFFRSCFDKSFDKIELNEKQFEIEFLLRIYENYENEITPRRIINFINQLATYYIQNSTIKLRYFAIVILKKDILFKGIINENIINRNGYLDKLDTFFTEDDKLELNLAKIIYGVNNDSEAEESLLHSIIEDKLHNNTNFDDEILNLPYFYSYFDKYFKKFIDSKRISDTTNHEYFDNITMILNNLESYFIRDDKKMIYNILWEYYYQNMITRNKFIVFNETVIGVCNNCSRKAKIELINKSLDYIIKHKPNSTNILSKDAQILYIDFLKNVDSYIAENNNLHFNDLVINEKEILPELVLELLNKNKELYEKAKFKVSLNNLKNSIIESQSTTYIKNSKLSRYRHELSFLNQIEKLDFIEQYINNELINNSINHVSEIDMLIFYHDLFNEINIDKISNITFSSIIDIIIKSEIKTDLTNAFLLIFINYDRTKVNSIIDEFRKALIKFDMYTYQNMNNKIKEYSIHQKLYKVITLNLEFNSPQNLTNFSINLLQENTFKLDDEGFNWILENYSILISKIFNNDIFDLYDYLNRNAKNHSINNIEKIDLELITESNEFLNTELINKANDYLLDALKINKSFLQNISSKEYKLFEKLLNMNVIDNNVFNDNFTHSFVNLVINNNLSIQISNEIIIKIKTFIDSNKLKSIIELNLNRIISRNKIYILTPEIFSFFEKMSAFNKNRILQSLVNSIDFYNEELFDQIIISGNINIINNLKNNISNHPKIQIKELAIKKGLI